MNYMGCSSTILILIQIKFHDCLQVRKFIRNNQDFKIICIFLTNRLILVKSGKKPDLKIGIHKLTNQDQNRFTVELLRFSKNIIYQILPMVCLIRFKTSVEQ